jgi:serine protease Do
MNIKIGLGIMVLAAAWAQPTPPTAPTPPTPPTPPAPATRSRNVQRLMVTNEEGSYLGIGTKDIGSDRAKALKLKEERGAEVTKVYEDSPAAKAGFKEGDVVMEFNGQKVEGTEQLSRMVRETPPERQVKIVVWRNGASETLTATIGTRNNAMALTMPEIDIPQFTMPDVPRFQMNWQNPRLGIMGEALGQEQQLAEFFGVKQGVLVKSVDKNSAAEKAGIKAGDVVVKVGDSNVATTEEITRALRSSLQPGKTTLNVVVVRNKRETTIAVTIENQGSGAIRNVVASTRV